MHETEKLPLHGSVALVTGATSGIGLVTARVLAEQGAFVYLACRSEARSRALADQVQAACGRACMEWIALELGDFASIRAAAQQVLKSARPLHLLINNAGLAGARGCTASGFETAFGVNHLGHFLLTRLLLDHLRASGPARVVTVASRAHRRATGLDWDAVRRPTRSWTGIPEYAASKLANVLFGAELARQLAGSTVSSYSLHPGVVDTEVWRALPGVLRPLLRLRGLIDAEEGARTTLHCSLHASPAESGRYFAQSQPQMPSPMAQDTALAAELWQRSLDWTAP